jgi:hypothetical protein
MTESPELVALDGATTRYHKAQRAHIEVAEAIVAALKAGESPSVVAARSPFSLAQVRVIARAAGIPPAKPGPKPKTTKG